MTADPFLQAADARGLTLDPVLRAFHGGTGQSATGQGGTGPRVWEGTCAIRRGSGPLIGLLLKLGGFPDADENVPIRLSMFRGRDGVTWRREFGRHVTESVLTYDADRSAVDESFGPFSVRMVPDIRRGALHLEIAGLRVWGVPLPRLLWPKSATREVARPDGGVEFDVSATLPFLGPMIRYRGVLHRAGGARTSHRAGPEVRYT
ncbi:DUF4166 domain-containing protein [Oceanicola sp. 22II-s10i]|uniref:DUF4166 domain-containing protein n=1 Tax=Oceanicola sp. 22II-s10i TaxID=1317116 RepID=UPI001596077C|nr:DUF4166 domain-containing protein [Oceanicola sp. 22II-s10i]